MLSTDQSGSITTAKWLSVVGIGEDGTDGLAEETKSTIAAAKIVFGGNRHLALASTLITGESRPWPSPFDAEMAAVRSLRGTPVCVLASGDPFMHGIGAALARYIPPDEMRVIPHPSAFSLAAARLGWALQDTETVSLHGRDIAHVRPLLHPNRRVLALTSNADGPRELAELLTRSGYGRSTLTVLEALGGEHERITEMAAACFDLPAVNPLNLVAVSVVADDQAQIIPLTPGCDDDLFDHDGQITKCRIRALTLSALTPRRGELLWDIGAGAGSVAIEWMLRDPSMRAIAIEAKAGRAARIADNAHKLGVPSLQTIVGSAPDALEGLPQPDAIFVGGGGSRKGVMDRAMEQIRSGGRLVANAVTLEMEALVLGLHSSAGGELVRLMVANASPVGTMTGWRPSMPVTQWIWTKP